MTKFKGRIPAKTWRQLKQEVDAFLVEKGLDESTSIYLIDFWEPMEPEISLTESQNEWAEIKEMIFININQ